MKEKKTGWILIAGILVITVLALGLNTFLKGDTQNAAVNPYEETVRSLFPNALTTSDALENLSQDENGFVIRVRHSNSQTGYAVQQVVQGYAGPVEVITGVMEDGTLSGIQVGGRDFKETEGLGAKAKDASFTNQFKGKKAPVTLGQNIDAIAGATVTSQAVVDAVNQSFDRIAQLTGVSLQPSKTAIPEPPSADGSTTANASAMGYGGPVLVRLTLDDQGKISALDIGGARFAETQGVGSKVRDEGFAQAFIGLTPPLKLGEDVDAVSGATISSQAVVDAVNEAAAFLKSDSK